MIVKHNIISSFDKAEIAENRIFNFIQEFAKNTLNTDCYELSIKKDETIQDKTTFNQNTWNHKHHLTSQKNTVYDFVFNIERRVNDKKNMLTAYYLRYSRFLKDVQGKVYYANGNVVRIVFSCYGDQHKLLKLMKFNSELHSIINKYYRLTLAATLQENTSNKFIRGRIECSFQVKKGNVHIQHVISDEQASQVGQYIVAGKTSQGMSSVLPNLLMAVVDKKENFYENFMIQFDKGVIKKIISIKLDKLQHTFTDLPKLSELIRSDNFDDYLIILEMEQI